MDIGFSNVNPVLHCPGTILGVGVMENWGRVFGGNDKSTYSIYSHAYCESISEVQYAFYLEEVALAEAIGVDLQRFPKKNFLSRTSILGPEYMGDECIVPFDEQFEMAIGTGPFSIHDRYITEDIPVGCHVYHELGKKFDVETKIIDSMITLASVMTGQDFSKEGLTLDDFRDWKLRQKCVIGLFKSRGDRVRKAKNLQTEADLISTIQVAPTAFSGFAIGIIAVNLIYPKIPGNVANATTFAFPVLYEVVDFEIEQLFEGSKQIQEQVIDAAKKLEKQGVRAIVGACGYFGHFQEAVSEAVDIPAFLSSISQVPIIKLGLKKEQKILTLVASGKDINEAFFRSSGADLSDCIIREIGTLESFSPIRWGKTELDNQKLEADLVKVVQTELNRSAEIGAILLECSDLPPYSYAIQQVSGLPVFDFISLINWVHFAVVQSKYYGHF